MPVTGLAWNNRATRGRPAVGRLLIAKRFMSMTCSRRLKANFATRTRCKQVATRSVLATPLLREGVAIG